MSEYGAESPVWDSYEGMVLPEDDGISARLSRDLVAWQHHFELHLHHETGWDSRTSREWYASEAERLYEAVARELEDSVELTVDLWPHHEDSITGNNDPPAAA